MCGHQGLVLNTTSQMRNLDRVRDLSLISHPVVPVVLSKRLHNLLIFSSISEVRHCQAITKVAVSEYEGR